MSIKRLPNDRAGICISSLTFARVRRDLIGSKRANSPDQNQSKVPLSSFKGACLTSVFPQEERTKGDDGDSWPGMTKTDTKENITPQGYIMAADASPSREWHLSHFSLSGVNDVRNHPSQGGDVMEVGKVGVDLDTPGSSLPDLLICDLTPARALPSLRTTPVLP